MGHEPLESAKAFDRFEPFDPVRRDLAAALAANTPGGWGSHAIVQARVLWPMHVISLRTVEPQASPWTDALHAAGVHEGPHPGRFTGHTVRVIWGRPTECLAMTQDALAAQALLEALRPGAWALGCAVDRSAGMVAIELGGPGLDHFLARLVDASAIPKASGQATRARMVDIAVHLLRIDSHLMWLLLDRAHADYLSAWLVDASQRIEA